MFHVTKQLPHIYLTLPFHHCKHICLGRWAYLPILDQSMRLVYTPATKCNIETHFQSCSNDMDSHRTARLVFGDFEDNFKVQRKMELIPVTQI